MSFVIRIGAQASAGRLAVGVPGPAGPLARGAPAPAGRRTPTGRPGPCPRVASLLLLLCALVSCGPGEKEFTFLVRDADNRAVAGVEVRLAGEDRRLGLTDDKGRATMRVRVAKEASLRFRLADAGKPGSPRYRFPDVIEVDAASLQSGVKTVWLEAAKPTEADPAGPVTLRITSEPSGGQAFLDGGEVGATPTNLHEVTPGRHQIEVRMAGRQSYTLEVVLEPGEHSFHADLPRQEEARATLHVTSDPPGAQVVLDGRPSGRVTPTVLDGLPPGRHALRLEKDGFEPFQATVDLTAGGPGGSAGGALRPRLLTSQDLEEAAHARPEATPGATADPGPSREYLISTAPGWAEVYLDNESTNRNVAGRFKAVLAAGRHTFRVLNSKAGIDVSLQFEVGPGGEDKRLVLNYATGRVEARP
jgi:hypothetical protein